MYTRSNIYLWCYARAQNTNIDETYTFTYRALIAFMEYLFDNGGSHSHACPCKVKWHYVFMTVKEIINKSPW